MNLDFSFLNWDILSSFVLKGLIFSVQLTLVAMIGGIALGTVLALMRLSGKKWLVMPAAFYVNTLRSIPLVMVILWFFLLIPLMIGQPMGAELSAIITFTPACASVAAASRSSARPRASSCRSPAVRVRISGMVVSSTART